MIDFAQLAQQRCAEPLPMPIREWAETVPGLDIRARSALLALLIQMWENPTGTIKPTQQAMRECAGVSRDVWQYHVGKQLWPYIVRVPAGFSHELIQQEIRRYEAEAIAKEAEGGDG